MTLLRWSNRTKLASEMTRRGYDVDGETLNRWVRTNYEVPEKAARYIREIYGVDTTKAPPAEAEGAMPEWAEALMRRDEVVELVERIQQQVTKEIRANRDMIVAALTREVTRRTVEGSEPLLTQIRDALTRVERRLAE